MFIVSRKIEESVIVDGFSAPQRELKVTVLEVKGCRVKLCFEVNADLPVQSSQVQAWKRNRDFIGPDRTTASPEAFGA